MIKRDSELRTNLHPVVWVPAEGADLFLDLFTELSDIPRVLIELFRHGHEAQGLKTKTKSQIEPAARLPLLPVPAPRIVIDLDDLLPEIGEACLLHQMAGLLRLDLHAATKLLHASDKEVSPLLEC